MIKAEYFERKHAYDHLEDMVSVDESLLEGVPEEMRPKMPFSLEDAISWNKRAGGRCAAASVPQLAGMCRHAPAWSLQSNNLQCHPTAYVIRRKASPAPGKDLLLQFSITLILTVSSPAYFSLQHAFQCVHSPCPQTCFAKRASHQLSACHTFAGTITGHWAARASQASLLPMRHSSRSTLTRCALSHNPHCQDPSSGSSL